MNLYLDDALEEMKRVDHLVTVSLKYTRTVDVLKSVIERMISSFDCIIEAILQDLKEKKEIKEIPQGPGLRLTLLQKHFKDNPEIQENLDFYATLRKISRSTYSKREEYRRHVTMISQLDDGTIINVDIDMLTENYEKTMNFFKLARTLIEGEKE